jgi:hypothetical protein
MTIDNTISFRADMIDLILSGRKTVTIRPMKPQPKPGDLTLPEYPHGRVGDIVTVRERPDIRLRITGRPATWLHAIKGEYISREGLCTSLCKWCKIAGGYKECNVCICRYLAPQAFYRLWESLYGDTEYKWENNPCVWAIQFELVEGRKSEMTIDQTQEIAHD